MLSLTVRASGFASKTYLLPTNGSRPANRRNVKVRKDITSSAQRQVELTGSTRRCLWQISGASRDSHPWTLIGSTKERELRSTTNCSNREIRALTLYHWND